MLIYQKIRDFALKHSSTDSAFSSFLILLYKIYISEFTQVINSILGTIVIGIMLACKYFKFGFYVAVILYLITLSLSTIANKYKNERVLETKMLNQSLLGISQILCSWSICLQKCAKKLVNSKKNKREIDLILCDVDFQTAAFTVCQKLHNNLTKYCNNYDIYITVYQKYKKGNENYCKMIAYSTENEPSSFGEEYLIPNYSEDLIGKIPYHSYLFSLDSTNFAILPNYEAIKKCFVTHKINEEREADLQQYIGLPISIAKQGVSFILQVDTCKKSLFGNNKKEIESFVKTVLLPYPHFLHMIYEEARIILEVEGGINNEKV